MLSFWDRAKIKFFLLLKLPAAFWSGITLFHLDSQSAEVSIKHSWRNQNPFRSIYFACLAMAAEFASGILAYSVVKEFPVKISMLVVNLEVEFTKKATGNIIFTCNQGDAIRQVIQQSIDSGSAQSIQVFTEGIDEDQESVAKFKITWSFKAKK